MIKCQFYFSGNRARLYYNCVYCQIFSCRKLQLCSTPLNCKQNLQLSLMPIRPLQNFAAVELANCEQLLNQIPPTNKRVLFYTLLKCISLSLLEWSKKRLIKGTICIFFLTKNTQKYTKEGGPTCQISGPKECLDRGEYFYT